MSSGAPTEISIQARVVGAEAAQRDLERINSKLGDPKAQKALGELKDQLEQVNKLIASSGRNASGLGAALKKLGTQTAGIRQLRQALADVSLESGSLTTNQVGSPYNVRRRQELRSQGLAQGFVQGMGGPGAATLFQRGAGGIAQVLAFAGGRTASVAAQALLNPQNLPGAVSRLPFIGPIVGQLAGLAQQAGQKGLGFREQLFNSSALTGGLSDTAEAQNARSSANILREAADKITFTPAATMDAFANVGPPGSGRLSNARTPQQLIDNARKRRLENAAARFDKRGDVRRSAVDDIVSTGARFGFQAKEAFAIASGASQAGGRTIQDTGFQQEAFALRRFGISEQLTGRAARGLAQGDTNDRISRVLGASLGDIRTAGFSRGEETLLLRKIAEGIAQQNETGIKFSSDSFVALTASLANVRGISEQRASVIASQVTDGSRRIGLEGPKDPTAFRALLLRTGGRLDRRSVAEGLLSLQSRRVSGSELSRLSGEAARATGADPNTPEGIIAVQQALRGSQLGVNLGEEELRGIASDPMTPLRGRGVDVNIVRRARERTDPELVERAGAEARAAVSEFDLGSSAANLQKAQAGVIKALGAFSESIEEFTAAVSETTGGTVSTQ